MRDTWTSVLKNSTSPLKNQRRMTKEEISQMKKRKDFNNMIDKYYKDVNVKQGDYDPKEVGRNGVITYDLIRNTKISDMTPKQVQEIIRHFADHSFIF